MVLRLVGIGVIEVRAGRFVGFNKFFGGFDTQGIPMAIEVANDSPRFIGSRLHFVGDLEIAGSGLRDVCSNALLEACFSSLTRFVGIVAAAALQHGSPVEECQTKGSTKGNVFYAPKNGMLTKGCHGLNKMMFSH